jgi:cytochrome c
MKWRMGIRRLRQSRWLGLSTISIVLGLLLIVFPVGEAASSYAVSPARLQGKATPTPLYNPSATPPTQGGHGQDVFYIYCMPCHGDEGQGLTDEFRTRQYPPEDTNCWKAGCHGERPYDNGFTLPKTIPALIGSDALSKFNTAQDIFNFIHTAMPFNKPGSLTDTQYLQVLAFLLERNQIVSPGVQLQASSLAQIVLRAPAPAATAVPDRSTAASPDNVGLWMGLIAFIVIATLLSIVTRPRQRS